MPTLEHGAETLYWLGSMFSSQQKQKNMKDSMAADRNMNTNLICIDLLWLYYLLNACDSPSVELHHWNIIAPGSGKQP